MRAATLLAAPVDLRTESLRDPLAVGTRSPRFSWTVNDPRRGVRDTHFRIVVTRDPVPGDTGKTVWDSGRRPSDGLPRVRYGGETLAPGHRYLWRVRWWDHTGRASAWSEAARFGVGLLDERDWAARWITKRRFDTVRVPGTFLLGAYLGDYVHRHAAYFRTEFPLRDGVRRATLSVCGLGFAEAWINGARVGDHVLDPGQTDYARRALYSTYDVTDMLAASNALGVIVGNGRHEAIYGFGPPRLIAQLIVDYAGSTRDVIVTEPRRWRCAHGPVRENGIYLGERYDARLEMPGWSRPGFDDSGWERVTPAGGPPLQPQPLEPIRVIRRIRARSLARVAPGTWIFDFGENVAGWARLRVRGPRGTEIRLRFAETLHPDGRLNPLPNENARATDEYVMAGTGTESWEPRFTYHGFRYVELTGFPGVPTEDTLEACVVHSDVEPVGSFHCSDDLVNRIHENVRRGQRSNLHSVPTDCCQRDERLGWLGDAQLAAEESVFNFGMRAFYEKLLDDIADAQRDDGALPDAVPAFVKRLYPADPSWGTALVTIAWLHYRHYGDESVLSRHYRAMRRYVDFLHQAAERGIQTRLGKYGDWCPPGSIAPRKTPLALTATWSYLHDTAVLARIAGILGKSGESRALASRTKRIAKAFDRGFRSEGLYASLSQRPQDRDPSQTSQALPLHLDLVPRRWRRRAFEELVFAVETKSDAHLDTGILGARYVPEVLSRGGRHDLAFRVATQTSYPSWGYMIREGATTLWERWEKLAGPSMNSHNHIMLGSIDAWFYRFLAGIDGTAPGWRALAIRPHVPPGLDHAGAELKTARGVVRASWERTGEGLALDVEIPVGAMAEVDVPTDGRAATIEEDGRVVLRGITTARRVPGVAFRGRDERWASFRIASGRYRFFARNRKPEGAKP